MAATAPPMPAEAELLARQKAALRQELKERRRAMSPDERSAASERAALRLLDLLAPELPAAVACFASMGEEIDTAFLIERLRASRSTVILPRQVGRGLPLALHRVEAGESLVPGPFGVHEPAAGAPLDVPRIVVVPLLGFDEAGHRLGYGAGFYDRTLAELRARVPDLLAVGFAFETQVCAELPVGGHDERLDAIVTEAGVRKPRRAAGAGEMKDR